MVEFLDGTIQGGTQRPARFVDGVAGGVSAIYGVFLDGVQQGVGGGAAPWTPADITTLAWYDASDASTVTESSGAVSQWDDKSGNLRHVSQGTGARQPVWDTVDKITFDGTDDFLWRSSAFMYANGDCNVFVVGGEESLLVNRAFVGEGASGTDTPLYLIESVSGALAAFSRNDSGTKAPNHAILSPVQSINTKRLLAWRDTGSAFTGFVNGTEETTSAYTRAGTCSVNQFAVGAVKKSGSDNYINAFMHEVVVTPNLSTGDREKMEGYLAWKHGLESDLPSGHPYESAAP